MEKRTLLTLKERAAKIRMHSVDAVYGAKSGHPGGSLSIADVITYLYFHKMKNFTLCKEYSSLEAML